MTRATLSLDESWHCLLCRTGGHQRSDIALPAATMPPDGPNPKGESEPDTEANEARSDRECAETSASTKYGPYAAASERMVAATNAVTTQNDICYFTINAGQRDTQCAIGPSLLDRCGFSRGHCELAAFASWAALAEMRSGAVSGAICGDQSRAKGGTSTSVPISRRSASCSGCRGMRERKFPISTSVVCPPEAALASCLTNKLPLLISRHRSHRSPFGL